MNTEHAEDTEIPQEKHDCDHVRDQIELLENLAEKTNDK